MGAEISIASERAEILARVRRTGHGSRRSQATAELPEYDQRGRHRQVVGQGDLQRGAGGRDNRRSRCPGRRAGTGRAVAPHRGSGAVGQRRCHLLRRQQDRGARDVYDARIDGTRPRRFSCRRGGEAGRPASHARDQQRGDSNDCRMESFHRDFHRERGSHGVLLDPSVHLKGSHRCTSPWQAQRTADRSAACTACRPEIRRWS